jgi:tetratricopeptide (TPR) repeat protein
VFHFSQARGFLADLEHNFQPGEFTRQWYLYVSSELQAVQSLEEVHGHLIAARKRYPADADMLVSSAEEYESYARIGSPPPPIDREVRLDLVRGHEVAADVKSALETAATWLSAALAASPDHEEAHLRLGRVLTGLGQFDRASEHLEIVRRQAQDPNLKYLALLFLAAAERGVGHQPRAVALYADALRLFPGQAGFVGLSEAFYDDGRMVEARAVLLRGFDAARNDDPWFAYPLGDGWHAKARLQTVRGLAIK